MLYPNVDALLAAHNLSLCGSSFIAALSIWIWLAISIFSFSAHLLLQRCRLLPCVWLLHWWSERGFSCLKVSGSPAQEIGELDDGLCKGYYCLCKVLQEKDGIDVLPLISWILFKMTIKSLCVIFKCSFSNQRPGKLLLSSATHIQTAPCDHLWSWVRLNLDYHAWCLFVHASVRQKFANTMVMYWFCAVRHMFIAVQERAVIDLLASCFSLLNQWTCPFSALALSVHGHRALFLCRLSPSLLYQAPLGMNGQIEDGERWATTPPPPPVSPIYLSPLRALCQTSFQALKSSKSTHCRIHCHLAELGHSSALGGQILLLPFPFLCLLKWRKCCLAWHCWGLALCID